MRVIRFPPPKARSPEETTLPYELLLRIWDYWVENLDPRIVKVGVLYYEDDDNAYHTFTSSTPVPAILRVNKDTRALGMKKYAPQFSCDGDLVDKRESPIYFSLDKDTLYFGSAPPYQDCYFDGRLINREEPQETDYGEHLRRSSASSDFDDGPWKSTDRRLKHLAIWLPLEPYHKWAKFVRNISYYAPRLETLVLVVEEVVDDYIYGIPVCRSRWAMFPWPETLFHQCPYHVRRKFKKMKEQHVIRYTQDEYGEAAEALRTIWLALHRANPSRVGLPPAIKVRMYYSTEGVRSVYSSKCPSKHDQERVHLQELSLRKQGVVPKKWWEAESESESESGVEIKSE